MNVVIHKFRDYEFSPMSNRVAGGGAPQMFLSRYVSLHGCAMSNSRSDLVMRCIWVNACSSTRSVIVLAC